MHTKMRNDWEREREREREVIEDKQKIMLREGYEAYMQREDGKIRMCPSYAESITHYNNKTFALNSISSPQNRLYIYNATFYDKRLQ